MVASALFEALCAQSKAQAWQYIYPVWSRRAQGISIGINLHPNHCCNWHCLYCQVPTLQRGPSPIIDVPRLAAELNACLSWLRQAVQAHHMTLRDCVQDIAFAGDGEPTTSPQFHEIIELVSTLLHQLPLDARPVTVRLITNGSQLHHAHVQHALTLLQQLGGEVWFKVDAGNDSDMREINDCHHTLALHLQRLKICCSLCKTWVQTAVVARKRQDTLVITPTLNEYLAALMPFKDQIAGILLYGISRPSQQDHLAIIQPSSPSLLASYAKKMRTQGFCVRMFA